MQPTYPPAADAFRTKISEFLDHYEIAVFMPELTDEDKVAIGSFVDTHPRMNGSARD